MSYERRKKKLCIVHLCINEGYHLFPKNETRKMQWIQAIEHFKRGAGGVTVRKYSQICSAHFKPNDYQITPLSKLQPNVAPKILKKTAIPSIFPWKTDPQEPSITCDDQDTLNTSPESSELQDSPAFNLAAIQRTYERTRPIAFVEEQPYLDTVSCESSEDPLKCSMDVCSGHEQPSAEDASYCKIEKRELDIAENLEIAEHKEITHKEITHHEKYVQTHDNSINHERLDKSTQTQDSSTESIHYYRNNDRIHFYTDLGNFHKFMFDFQTLRQCVNK